MEKLISEKSGNRKFRRLSRWNSVDYTLISRSNRFAKYADNFMDNNADRLNLTCFRFGARTLPLNKFGKFDKPIILEDLSHLSRIDTEENILLEINSDKTKVRLYMEVK